jgi:predicted regulator of Ras-like GTPase activity (Roadblock/LC7/MglB family)
MHRTAHDLREMATGRARASDFYMFSFIKSLFGNTRSPAAVPKSSISPHPEIEKGSPPPPRPALSSWPRSAPSFAPPTAAPPTAVPVGPFLELPLQPIAERLTPALRSRLSRSPERADIVKLPLSTALEQLPRDAIKIPFRLLKQGAPPDAFLGTTDVDETLVDVPLAEVLSRLPPTHLARRPAQRRVPVPDGLATVFASRHSPVTAAPCWGTSGKVEVSTTHDELRGSQLMAEPRRPLPAARPGPFTGAGPALARPSLNHPPVVTPQPPSMPAASSNMPRAGASPQPEAEPLKVALVSLARNWPDPMRREILATHLAASVNLPFAELEAAMKRGKVVFSWKQLRLWMSPKASTALSEHDAVNLELPLAILTPLFLARRSAFAKPRKASAGHEIPDVFLARKTAEQVHTPASPALSATPVEQPASAPGTEPAAVPAPASASIRTGKAPPSSSLAATQLDKLTAARSSPVPTELVQRACQLSGVAGALVATPDGLVIASQLPSSMNAEMAAAFLPQIYSRLGQYTRELKLGDPTQLEMLVGKIPLQIFRTNSTYFAVLGKAAEPLPKLQLTALATQLSVRTN